MTQKVIINADGNRGVIDVGKPLPSGASYEATEEFILAERDRRMRLGVAIVLPDPLGTVRFACDPPNLLLLMAAVITANAREAVGDDTRITMRDAAGRSRDLTPAQVLFVWNLIYLEIEKLNNKAYDLINNLPAEDAVGDDQNWNE